MNTFENNMFSSIIFLSLLDHVIIKGAWEHPGLTRSDYTKQIPKFRGTYTRNYWLTDAYGTSVVKNKLCYSFMLPASVPLCELYRQYRIHTHAYV